MGTAAATIFNHALTAGQALAGNGASPADSSTTGTPGTSGADASDSTSSGSATISANDFLTLLVTEMQNQDPTADTDPNEYIDQLVQVNSLEQLIDINQTLSGALGATSSSAGGSSAQVAGAAKGATATNPMAVTARAAAAPSAVSAGSAAQSSATASSQAPGNGGVPRVSQAARRVGHALDGRTPARHVKNSAIPLQ